MKKVITMIYLAKVELQEILKRKNVRLLALAIAMFMVLPNLIGCIRISKDFGSISNYKEVAKSFEEKYTRKELRDLYQESLNKQLSSAELTNEDKAILSELRTANKAEVSYFMGEESYTLSQIEERLKEMDKTGEKESYEYKKLEKAFNMISKVPEYEYRYTGGWMNLTDFNVAATFITILVVLGLAPLFNNDNNGNMTEVVLSTREGRRKAVTSKIMAGLIYGMIVFLYINSLNFISGFPLGLDGANGPANSLYGATSTPYNITIIEYYFTCLGLAFIATLLLALIVMILSLPIKNLMATIITGVGLYFLSPSLINIFRDVDVISTLRAKAMVGHFTAINIFGTPVMQIKVAVIMSIISIIIATFLIKYLGKKRVLA